MNLNALDIGHTFGSIPSEMKPPPTMMQQYHDQRAVYRQHRDKVSAKHVTTRREKY